MRAHLFANTLLRTNSDSLRHQEVSWRLLGSRARFISLAARERPRAEPR